eukprot:Phypoly_transcript_06944.p1 GENE.Phypoly_transcript_06944~~Phypoly_transcript_06944.p1  ORF type:complete len:161 (+),score=22.50 Phypoly_transcript_06944:801-1283(+)
MDRQAAKILFDKLHDPSSQTVRASEIYSILKQLGIPNITVKKVLQVCDDNKDGEISFDEFYRHVWNVGQVQSRLHKVQHRAVDLTPEDKAKLIFEMLDIDDSGSITLTELEMLLTQWGMPHNEALSYISGYGGANNKIEFQEFYQDMRPVWDFAATFVFN